MKREGKLASRLKLISKSYKSEKIDEVELILEEVASRGEFEVTLFYGQYDKYVLKWLEEEGFTVTENGSQRDGTFIQVSWN